MEDQLTFEQYLTNKKIDADKFKSVELAKYQELASDFLQMNPNSFTSHYLFLINPIRRKYLLAPSLEEEVVKKSTVARPKFKR